MKPLLAEAVNFDKLRFPLYASPKYDGYRCLLMPQGPVSRNLKPIANHFVRGKLAESGCQYIDGELLTYSGDKLDDFNVIQSKLSSRNGLPEFRFMAFDSFKQPKLPYKERLQDLACEVVKSHFIYSVEQKPIYTLEQLEAYEAECLQQGWEGVMVRDPMGVYKYGRSTVNEGILLKLKRFHDSEGLIVGRYEKLHNANEAQINALGYTERSSHKANMVAMGVLGGFTVRWNGVEFDLGTGFDDDDRRKYWELPDDEVIGKTVNFKYQSVGPNGKPRFPVFRGFRFDHLAA